MSGILGAWFVEMALITYRGFKRKTTGPLSGLPLPADYVGATIIFGGISLLGGTQAAGVGAVFAWGLVVATAVNLWTPNSPASIGAKAKAAAAPPPRPSAQKVSTP